MLDVIWEGMKRVVSFFIGGGEVVDTNQQLGTNTPMPVENVTATALELESPVPGILAEDLSTPLNTTADSDPVDLSRWKVTEYAESPFEKVGRLYVEGDNLVIRSDIDSRGFYVLLVDVDAVLEGEMKPVRLLDDGEDVGTTRLSVSGKAMNFSINPFFYTTPLQLFTRMLNGEQRKAPLFVGRDQVG